VNADQAPGEVRKAGPAGILESRTWIALTWLNSGLVQATEAARQIPYEQDRDDQHGLLPESVRFRWPPTTPDGPFEARVAGRGVDTAK
jgi:hypothetical protein